MSYPWEAELTESERRFLPAQQQSRRLAAIIENSNTGSIMPPLNEDLFGLSRPSTTTSIPPRWISGIVDARQTQQTPPRSAETTTLEYPPAGSTVRYPTLGRTESRFGFSRPSTSMSAPPRPSSHLTTLEYSPTTSTVRYPASERPGSRTASLPPRPSSNATPTQRPETQSQPTRAEDACCLPCAKESPNFSCSFGWSRTGNRCIRCLIHDYACTPIPAEHLSEFRAIQKLYREGKTSDAIAARQTWIESMESTTPLARIERQLFLLNRNVERLLNVYLRMIGEPAPRIIEEEFPENRV